MRSWVGVLVVGLATVILIGAGLIFIPRALVSAPGNPPVTSLFGERELNEMSLQDQLSVQRLVAEQSGLKQDAINSLRGHLLQGVGGLVILITGLVGWHRLRVARSQLEIERERHVTDRFARAVEGLGSDDPHIRLGTVFALERIAKDSAPDRRTIFQILCALLRDRADEDKKLSVDLKSVVEVIGRYSEYASQGAIPIDLTGLTFKGEYFHGLDLTGVHMLAVRVRDSTLHESTMRGAEMSHSVFRGCDFAGSDLVSARLHGCDLRESGFTDATLENADLSSSDLSDSILAANLAGADLSEANLTRADLLGAEITAETIFAETIVADVSGFPFDVLTEEQRNGLVREDVPTWRPPAPVSDQYDA